MSSANRNKNSSEYNAYEEGRSLTSNALESEINSVKLGTYHPKYLSLKKYKVTYSLLVNCLWIRARNYISSLVKQETPHIRLHCKNWLVSFCLKHSYHFFLPDNWKKKLTICIWKSRQTRIIKKANFLGEFVSGKFKQSLVWYHLIHSVASGAYFPISQLPHI